MLIILGMIHVSADEPGPLKGAMMSVISVCSTVMKPSKYWRSYAPVLESSEA